jgi:class 3 adenylate cyclase/tetratricopeptide (TPR) repeat protein
VRCAACGQENPPGFRFCGACGATLAEAPSPREVRKVVTVVFCDLSGSTALGETTDPEALRGTMRGYYEEMRAILERHGGTVEKFIGDAVMAVFGVPISHEDDALRAVRAAWEMRAAVPTLGLTARIGVNTGEVVTGEGDTLVTGDAVNVAARLEQAADAGEVLIGPETQRLVRDAVHVDPVEVAAKGKAEPVAAFRLVEVDPEAAPVARRLDTPLIGRRAELEQLRGAFDRAVRERRCHLFTLLGPAGVGKSRLVQEFLDGLDAVTLHGRCLDYGEGITFWPVISILKQLGDRAEGTLARIVEGASTPNELFWAVRAQLEEVASGRPLVVCFDDIQWGEPTFLDLVDHVADLSRGAPILLLCVARPELLDRRPGWGGGKLNATTILLEPLSPEECVELIAVHGGVEDATQERILAHADGNPLFVEEMVALVREDGAVRVPATVQALLQARLDQLGGEERTVIERGAVEGQIFHRGALVELTRVPDVEPQLAGLVRKELIHPAPATLAGDQAFRFRHLLIRDAAYDSLPKETRAELHERFADWLEAHGHELIELDEVLGYHLEQAARYRRELGRPDPALGARAAERLWSAGRHAAARSDLPAAINLLGRAARLFPAEDERGAEATLDRLALLMTIENVTLQDERKRTIAELEACDDERLRLHARVARMRLDVWTDPSISHAELLALAEDALVEFERQGDERGLAAVWQLRAMVAWHGAHTAETAAAADQAAIHAARAGVVEHKGANMHIRFGPLVHGPFTTAEIRERLSAFPADSHARFVVGASLALVEGRYDESLALIEESVQHLTELGLPVDFAPPTVHRATVLRAQGRYQESLSLFREVADLQRGQGDLPFLSTTLVEMAETLRLLGELDEAERLAAEGEELGGSEDLLNFAAGRGTRARIASARGRHGDAEALARSALEYAYKIDLPGVRGRAHEALGDVLRASGRSSEARGEYERALEIWEHFGWLANAERVRGLLVEL